MFKFSKRFDVDKAIKDLSMLGVVLAASRTKLDMALNIRRDRKTYLEFFYKVSVPSAMVGFPITPVAMSNMFINDAYLAIRKSIKKLQDIASKGYKALNISYAVYNRIITSLSDIESRLKNVDKMQAEQCIEELKKCIDDLMSLCTELLSVLRTTTSADDDVSGY